MLSKHTDTRTFFLSIILGHLFWHFWEFYGGKDTQTRSSFLAILGVFTEVKIHKLDHLFWQFWEVFFFGRFWGLVIYIRSPFVRFLEYFHGKSVHIH